MSYERLRSFFFSVRLGLGGNYQRNGKCMPSRQPLIGAVIRATAFAGLLACLLAFLLAFLGCFGGLFSRPAVAAGTGPLPLADVPTPLKPWVAWVLHDTHGVGCPQRDGQPGDSVCGWPGPLTLGLDANGGKFSQFLEVFETGTFPLPGSAHTGDGEPARWPLDVTVDGKRSAVVETEAKPFVRLSPGKHTVAGRFAWNTMPDALQVPASVGLVVVSVQGKPLSFPQRTADGRIFFAHAVAQNETDSVDITVHRKVTDGVPVLLTTRLRLAVSGKSREISLGRSLPDGFVALSVASLLPVRVKPDGRLTVQVRPGQWTIELVARNVARVAAIARPDPQGLWKEGEEAWVFEAAPAVRAVTVQGVAAIDPQQTTLPDEWKVLPTFAVEPKGTFGLVEHQRGNEPPQPDRLSLVRELWLDFNGNGFTARDQINGTLSQSWRLSMLAPAKLGRLAVNGEDQFITKLTDGAKGQEAWGAEIRTQEADIQADSRLPRTGKRISVVSWQHDFDALSGRVHLGPGWKLLFGTGADRFTGSWIQAWSLLDLFLLLIVAVSVQRLYGWRLGCVAFAALLLSLNEGEAPAWVWLAIVVGEAVVRLVPPGKLAWLPWSFRWGAWGVWLMIFLPFAASDVRAALHPAAAQGNAFWSVPMIGGAAAPQSPAMYLKAQKASLPDDVPPAPQESEEGNVVGSMDTRGYGGGISGLRGTRKDAATQNIATWDKSVVVQTGPGIPTWQWQTVGFAFNGPVQASQSISLWLLPPWLTSLLGLLRVALLALLAFFMFRRGHKTARVISRLPTMPLPTAALVLALCIGASSHAFAQSPPAPSAPIAPSTEILEALKERLLRPPACVPNCATLDELFVDASPQTLKLRFAFSSLAEIAVPLPGQSEGWMPSRITVNNQAAPSWRDASGVLWVVIGQGSSSVEAEGALPPKETFSIALPRVPKHASATAKGIRIDGLHADGQTSESLQFTRVANANTGSPAMAVGREGTDGLAALLLVHRDITLGLRWTTTTTATRQGTGGSVVVTEVPLLAGESVTTAGIRLSDNNRAVALNLAPEEQSANWEATLAQQETLTLTAPAADRAFTEEWQIAVGPTWNVKVQGIPTLREHERREDGGRVLLWRPWPGETVTLKISRPHGAEGQTLTIDSSVSSFTPGPRDTSVTLTLHGRTSRGREHVITLPAKAVVKSVTINGASSPARTTTSPNGTLVTLPLSPGNNQVVIDWRHSQGNATAFRPPQVDLAVPSTNATVTIHLESAGRWVLWTSGPVLGPSVFFWSYLLILALAGWALARTKLSPLSIADWALLGLGLIQVDLWAAAFVGAFFLFLGARSAMQRPQRAWAYNLTQLAFVGWSCVAAVLVFAAIRAGLLGSPDMRVVGNGSSESILHWYSDQAVAALPQPQVISVPIFVYRIAMMAWALWLALALLRWSRWVWQNFWVQGLWKPMRWTRSRPAPGESPLAP